MRPAGAGRTGTVWLAVHTGLDEYRAIKCVPKPEVDYETFRREALILKELRHPGVPIVYDLEEDSDNFYLIEEYLEGCSLYALIKDQGILQEAEALRYGVQLCSLVEYMHSACDEPILHLDLQPNNLMLCGGTLRLIDFGCAAGQSHANSRKERYGTKGCAAPEQYTSDRVLDKRTDIYAIGAVLRFMVQGTLMPGEDGAPEVSERLEEIIETCMDPDREKRYRSGGEAGEAMRRLLAGQRCQEKEIPFKSRSSQKQMPSLSVVLAGSRPGAGTTHLALGLCRYLTGRGYRVLYEEHDRSGAVRCMARQESARPDEFGIFRIFGCSMKPWYGQSAALEPPEGYEVILKDFGSSWREAAGEAAALDGRLLAVVTENFWETGRTERMLEALTEEGDEAAGERIVLVLRYRNRKRRLALPGPRDGRLARPRRGYPKQVLQSPEYENPFKEQNGEQDFFDRLWEALAEDSLPKQKRKAWCGRWKRRG